MEQSNDSQVTITLDGSRCRIAYGDDEGGRYVFIDYDGARPYILGERPRSELVELHNLAGDSTIMVAMGSDPAWSLHWPADQWDELTEDEQSAIVGRQVELMTGESNETTTSTTEGISRL